MINNSIRENITVSLTVAGGAAAVKANRKFSVLIAAHDD